MKENGTARRMVMSGTFTLSGPDTIERLARGEEVVFHDDHSGEVIMKINRNTAPLWTTADVAAYLRCSVRRVRRLVADRKLAFFQDGRRKKYREADVLYYAASRSFSHCQPASGPAGTK
jgi:excisionase family DNA binding protein